MNEKIWVPKDIINLVDDVKRLISLLSEVDWNIVIDLLIGKLLF